MHFHGPRQERVVARSGRPCAFVQSAQHHAVECLNPCFQRAEDRDARVSAALGAHGALAADVDGDNRVDILTAATGNDEIRFFRSLNDLGTVFENILIDDSADGARSVAVGDIDGDADLDIVTSSKNDGVVAWFEQRPELDFSIKHVLIADFDNTRVAITAEAAHVLPPIGAQGLNTSLNDIAALLNIATAAPGEIGTPKMLSTYEKNRARDITARAGVIDLFNRICRSDVTAIQSLRAAGLKAVYDIAPVRRAVMRAGLGP